MKVGIAIGAQSITAVARRGDTVRIVSTPLIYDGSDVIPALVPAMQELRARLDAAVGQMTQARAHIVLLPPLADTRLLTLPPLRAAEAEAVVRRDAGRYFMGIAAPRVVAVRVPTRARAGAPVVAGAAGAVLVEAVRAAIAGAGWRALSIAPAHAAWAAAASGKAQPHAIVAVDGDTAHIIRLEHGAPVLLRRLPADATNEIVHALSEATTTGAAVAIFAHAPLRDGLVRELTRAGLTPSGLSAPADEVAARYADEAAMPLVPLTMLAERRDQEKRVALRLAVAAVLLLLATAVVQLWGARRELNIVRGRRAEIRADVVPLLSLRDSAERMGTHVTEIEALARATPRFTAALFDIALLLPPEAYVTRLLATGDTLVIDAEGARAGIALQALRGAGSLRDARLLGSIDRELADGSTTVERFRLTARLAAATPTALARADTAAPRHGGVR